MKITDQRYQIERQSHFGRHFKELWRIFGVQCAELLNNSCREKANLGPTKGFNGNKSILRVIKPQFSRDMHALKYKKTVIIQRWAL